MKKNIFPIFITCLGLITAYVFYALWHSEEVNPTKTKTEEKTKKNKSLEDKKIIPKTSLIPPEIMNSNTPKVPSIPQKFQTQTMVEEESEKIYTSLRPEEDIEFIEEAKEAFDMLDRKMIEIDEKILEQEQMIETEMEMEQNNNLDEESESNTNDVLINNDGIDTVDNDENFLEIGEEVDNTDNMDDVMQE